MDAARTVEITNERDDVVLRGEFALPTTADKVTSRVAALAGSDQSANGSATLQRRSSNTNGPMESLVLDVNGLPFPSLYRVHIDESEVGVFSTTTSGHARLYLSRGGVRKDGELPAVPPDL